MSDFDIGEATRVPAVRTPDTYELADAACNSLQNGINKIANLVKTTIGPGGRPALLVNGRNYLITFDGVTVARHCAFNDMYDNAAATLIKEVAEDTVDAVGDGTTTSLVLAQAIVNEGINLMREADVSCIAVKEGIENTADNVIEMLKGLATPIMDGQTIDKDRLKHVATVSCNGDEKLGAVIADAIFEIGIHGFVKLSDSRNNVSSYTTTKGIEYDGRLLSHHYVKDEGGLSTTFVDPKVMVCSLDLQNAMSIVKVVKQCIKEEVPLVIVADRVEDSALAMLELNAAGDKRQGILPRKIAVVSAPMFGDLRDDIMKDLGMLSGAKVVETLPSGSDFEYENLGTCSRFYANETTVTFEANPAVVDNPEYTEYVDHLKNRMEKHVDEDDHEYFVKRYSQLSKGCADISVGGRTAIEMKERKHRVEDAYLACKTALKGGILPGGGFGLIHAVKTYAEYCKQNDKIYFDSKVNPKEEAHEIGQAVVLNALLAPIKQILDNCGFKEDKRDALVGIVLGSQDYKFGRGYNARTAEWGDMIEMGIIDPADVTITALDKAVSVSALTLTIGGLLIRDSY